MWTFSWQGFKNFLTTGPRAFWFFGERGRTDLKEEEEFTLAFDEFLPGDLVCVRTRLGPYLMRVLDPKTRTVVIQGRLLYQLRKTRFLGSADDLASPIRDGLFILGKHPEFADGTFMSKAEGIYLNGIKVLPFEAGTFLH